MSEPRNKRMQLTKLRAAPVRQAEVPPCAPAGKMDGGTASQLIRSVGRTRGEPGLVCDTGVGMWHCEGGGQACRGSCS